LELGCPKEKLGGPAKPSWVGKPKFLPEVIGKLTSFLDEIGQVISVLRHKKLYGVSAVQFHAGIVLYPLMERNIVAKTGWTNKESQNGLSALFHFF